MPARVMVLARIRNEDAKAFEQAYAEVTAKVKGTPGHLMDELLRHSTGSDIMPGAEPEPEPDDGTTSYILLSEWESRDAFLNWEREPIHMQTTTPMRPYWVGRVQRKIYDIAHRLERT
jgi:heme oxygenase (mycobilin-producing)